MAQFRTNRVSAASPLTATPPSPACWLHQGGPANGNASSRFADFWVVVELAGAVWCFWARTHRQIDSASHHIAGDGHSPRSLAESGVAGHIRVLECA